jgi:hypothetical protein
MWVVVVRRQVELVVVVMVMVMGRNGIDCDCQLLALLIDNPIYAME